MSDESIANKKHDFLAAFTKPGGDVDKQFDRELADGEITRSVPRVGITTVVTYYVPNVRRLTR